MLDAACPGAVFTSPTPDQYLAATRAVYGGAGALYVIKNFAGGVLNSEMAVELAQAEGYAVNSVLIHDDVAVSQVENRRGMGASRTRREDRRSGGRVRAKPARGHSRSHAAPAEQSRSMGVAVSSCTSPSVGHPTFDLPEHEMEVGVGIHGEPGRMRQPLTGASEIVDTVLTPIVDRSWHSSRAIMYWSSSAG